MTVLLVALGAALGAPLRYLADRAVQARHGSVFPWGRSPSTSRGRSCSASSPPCPTGDGVLAFAGTGFCGALSTYSTFGYETLRLAEDGARSYAVLNAAASIAAGLAAAYGGMMIARSIAG